MLEEIEESEHVTLININMRCIEMLLGGCMSHRLIKININMRCIEMQFPLLNRLGI